MKRHDLNLNDYQEFVDVYHDESDRSAIVLAGSFCEHYLATFLRGYMIEAEEVEALFERGALATFDARINVAYAFGFIKKTQRDELRIIKDIRNRFAHSPKLITMQEANVKADIERLSVWRYFENHEIMALEPHRFAYLLTIGEFVGHGHTVEQKRKADKAKK